MTYYRGWRVEYHQHAPVTGRWKAERFGVTMCSGTKPALLSMIDQRWADQKTGCAICGHPRIAHADTAMGHAHKERT